MEISRRRTLAGMAGAAGLFAPAVHAQPASSRPVRLVVAFPPGGAMDLIARMLAERLSPALKQNVVVENRTGAGGALGTAAVARSAPDGNTLLLSNPGPVALRPSLYPDLPYDPLRDFSPVAGVAKSPLVLVVAANSGIQSVAELIALGKSGRPVNYGSSGFAGQSQVGCEWFKLLTGTEFLHIPLNGAGPIVVELLAGRVQFSFLSMGDVVPRARDGQLRGLGVARAERTSLAANMPTLAEAGLPGLVLDTWYALMAPTGTPEAVVRRLHDETTRIIGEPQFRERLGEVYFEPMPMTPQETGRFLAADLATYADIVKRANIRAE
ncbi:Bug family tripartite tricarboxylate transporter substrate binding protein [Muricoccus roseus]|nr:tripartite tricarboxylate transporter substrate binding protein [Roseomonas rosea]